MAKNMNRTAIITSKDGLGLLWKVPVGTTTSLDPSVALPASAVCIGTISDGGVTLGEDTDGGTPIRDSDGDTVRAGVGSVTRSVTFTVWETETKAALEMVFHPDDITADADGFVTGYDESGRTPESVKLIMEFQTDNDSIGRRTYHKVTFQSRGEEVINYEGIAGREVVYTVERDAVSGKFYQTRVAKRAAGSGD